MMSVGGKAVVVRRDSRCELFHLRTWLVGDDVVSLDVVLLYSV